MPVSNPIKALWEEEYGKLFCIFVLVTLIWLVYDSSNSGGPQGVFRYAIHIFTGMQVWIEGVILGAMLVSLREYGWSLRAWSNAVRKPPILSFWRMVTTVFVIGHSVFYWVSAMSTQLQIMPVIIRANLILPTLIAAFVFYRHARPSPDEWTAREKNQTTP